LLHAARLVIEEYPPILAHFHAVEARSMPKSGQKADKAP